MKYLKISNKGSLNRKYLEIIGLSTKRDAGPNTIGHKGSGTKLSAVAALRLGLDIAIASTDNIGQYRLRFDKENVDIDGAKTQQIFFRYQPSGTKNGIAFSERYPSSMTIDAFKDWDQNIGDDSKRSFKVLREFMCNALDADPNLKLELVDHPLPVPTGETAVYLRYTSEIESIFKQPERYFKFMGGVPKPIFSMPAVGDIYPKSEPGKTRLFVQGVLVDCDASTYRKSIFDYSMREKTLVSEERIIKSITDYLRQVALLFGQLTHQQMAKNILAWVEADEAGFEEQALCQVAGITPASAKVWLSALHELYGEHLAIASGHRDIDLDCAQIYGHTVIGATSYSLQHFYGRLGIPRARDIVPTMDKIEYEPVDFKDLDQASQERFLRAFERLVRYFPDRAKLPIYFFYPLDEKMRRLAGFAGHGDTRCKEIAIATKTRTSLTEDEKDLFKTKWHEGSHCITGKGDYDRDFIRQAEDDIATVVYDGPMPRPSGLRPNFIKAPVKVGKPGPTSSVGSDELEIDIDALFDEINDPKGK